MIIRKGKETSLIVRKGHELIEVRKGFRLIWQSVRSCFGAGAWLNDKPWVDNEGWKN